VERQRDLTLAPPLQRALTPAPPPRRALTPVQLLALVLAAQQQLPEPAQPPRDPALPAAQQHGLPQVN
jgi:hypothetical protein